jgi:hypothetical protein
MHEVAVEEEEEEEERKTTKRVLRGKKFRSDQRSAASFREVGGAL